MSIEREIVLQQPEPEDGFSVFVSELPNVATQGETIEEATEMAKEAIQRQASHLFPTRSRYPSMGSRPPTTTISIPVAAACSKISPRCKEQGRVRPQRGGLSRA